MKKILAVDIGGTNSRFSAFEVDSGNDLNMIENMWLPSGEAESFDDLLLTLEREGFPCSKSDFDILVIAIAGPVKDNSYCSATNLDWGVDIASTWNYGFKRAVVINDFVAQAYACRTKAVDNIKQVQKAEIDPLGTLGVIGAGTGLGHCALVPVPGFGFVPVPSEAGHASFSFETKDEIDFGKFVCKKHGFSYCYGDIVLTGFGLNMLHLFLTGEDLRPGDVSRRMAEGAQTLEWYSRFYARSCRNYALSVLATGGLYISGGIAAKNPFVVDHPVFLEEFTESEKMSDVLKNIPVFLNDNQDSGVFGAAFRGLLALNAGL